jgi:hypothetical protein
VRRILANVFIIGFLAVQLILIVTCYARDPKFFGWQMFSHGLVYRIRVDAVGADGVTRPLEAAVYRTALGRRASHHLRTAETFHIFTRGKGFFLAEVARLPRYLCGELRAHGYRRIEVTVEHRDVTEAAAARQVFAGACDE